MKIFQSLVKHNSDCGQGVAYTGALLRLKIVYITTNKHKLFSAHLLSKAIQDSINRKSLLPNIKMPLIMADPKDILDIVK